LLRFQNRDRTNSEPAVQTELTHFALDRFPGAGYDTDLAEFGPTVRLRDIEQVMLEMDGP